MIPWYYAAIGAPVLLALGWAASTFNFLKSRSLYDAEAEKAELFAANIAQKVADYLKAPGK
jgi:hypothetical protein